MKHKTIYQITGFGAVISSDVLSIFYNNYKLSGHMNF